MATFKAEVKPTDWPSILDGDQSDRGWEHFLYMEWEYALAINDNVEVRLIVPRRESWLVEYIKWSWDAPVAWTSGLVLRELRDGQRREFLPNPGDWLPGTAFQFVDRTLYAMPGTDEENGNVSRSQMQTDLGGLPGGARLGLDWFAATAAGTYTFGLYLQVVRIPLSKERHWTEEDMKNALTRIEELGRRVT